MENRVHSIALVHESLYGSENLARIDFAEYAQGLAEDILDPSGSYRLCVQDSGYRMEAQLFPCA